MSAAGPFVVSWMPDCRDAVVRLVQRAIVLQQTVALARFLKALEVKLRTSPREWGDPIRDWPGLDAVEYAYSSAIDRFRVFYLVHNTSANVFVRDIVVLPDNPLRQTNGEVT